MPDDAVIETARLRLVPWTPAQLRALFEGEREFERQMGVPAARGLRELFVSGEVSPEWLEQLRAATAADPWKHGFAVIHPESGHAIGSAGFAGPPDGRGAVEIAYGIAPGHQGRGYATEVAAALVAYAVGSGRATLVLAHTLPVPNASTRVLAKNGFVRAGDHVDPHDGLVWRWERKPAAAAAVDIGAPPR